MYTRNGGWVIISAQRNDNNNLRIRPAVLADLDGIAAIEAACFPAAEAADREQMERRLTHFEGCFLVGELEGRLVGFVNGSVTDSTVLTDDMYDDVSLYNPKGDYQSIFGLDVLPEFRCRGFAARLMTAMIENARAQGRRGVILSCKTHMIHYYERFGYVNKGLSASVHGGATWYDMILEFER